MRQVEADPYGVRRQLVSCGCPRRGLERLTELCIRDRAETIKQTAFQITRMGQMVASEASRRLDVPFGIVDLSLAPTPAVGDSVARLLEEMGPVSYTHLDVYKRQRAY